jgi:hypothetical protein
VERLERNRPGCFLWIKEQARTLALQSRSEVLLYFVFCGLVREIIF